VPAVADAGAAVARVNVFQPIGDALYGSLLGWWLPGVLALWWVVVPVVAVVGFAIYAGWFIGVKGGGQFGIIEGYVGTIGAGKTTLAVQHSLKLAVARRAVLLSNIPVRCCNACEGSGSSGCEIEHRLLPMTDDGIDLGELTSQAFVLRDQERGLVLLMDEVGVIMPARLWKDFSVALMWVLQQSRKLACEWIWTAQDPSFVDHQLRSLTAAVHYVRCIPPPSIWRRVRGKRPWLMVVSSYTPSNAPRANSEGGRPDKRIGRRMVRYRRAFEAMFDTDGVVLPSRHLKGADVLVAAVEGLRDRHVIGASGSSWGEHAHGESEPGGQEETERGSSSA
jgi:Zonular occludens toxin (Zot)